MNEELQGPLTLRERVFSHEELLRIRAIVESSPGKHRKALSKMICEALDWRQANGRFKDPNLPFVVNNTRFLLFPWIRRPNLASRILSLVAKRLPDDWHRLYAYRPLVLETFVHADRHNGTCYRAANWVGVGRTQAGGRWTGTTPRGSHRSSSSYTHLLAVPERRLETSLTQTTRGRLLTIDLVEFSGTTTAGHSEPNAPAFPGPSPSVGLKPRPHSDLDGFLALSTVRHCKSCITP